MKNFTYDGKTKTAIIFNEPSHTKYKTISQVSQIFIDPKTYEVVVRQGAGNTILRFK